MTELESLIAARRKIDERIRQLKLRSVVYGRAKLDIEHYATSKRDEWYVAIDRILDVEACAGRDMKRYSIIRSCDREKCIEYIDEIIADLQGLKEAAKEGKKNE